ncbi:SDR family oxidoreductase [Robiginitalea aurantiaca]|uniref:SDR family oxidoreductase n=1 Tax=Robiginitalea aurantiaca TaxID=3056915 RepID=A0ABT7WFV1_9FLAO|nr:SDR family oxidoreductase [Robiginitalea aurantiaca]MDM9631689.1 SDR family oxidoreductase [Robiginitalea aurantiaca]
MKEFKENTADFALVIGGSQGLGLATVHKLLQEGIPVIAVHRDMRKDLAGIQVHFDRFTGMEVPFYSIHKDAIQEKGQEEILNEIKGILKPDQKIRLLVHSIAKGNLKPMDPGEGVAALSDVDFKLTGEAMAYSIYKWVQLLFRENLFSGDSRLVAFTSEGSNRVIPGYGAVAAAKAAMEAIIRQIAVEYAPRGLRANCVQAGVTPTASMKRIPGSAELLAHSTDRNPLGRLTRPEDVANAVYLLSRSEAAWITGTVIKVDGGESLC